MRPLPLALLLLAAACKDGGPGIFGGDDTDTEVTDDTGPDNTPACLGDGFGQSASSWSLPAGVASWDDWMDATAEASSSECARGDFRASVFELTGDGKPDLVVTDNCDVQGVGDDRWDVYPNTGSGFSGTATSWSLPAGAASWDDWMDATAESSSSECTRSEFTAFLTDMDGDSRVDLVVSDSCDVQGVGQDRWDVYLNTGSGFSGSATAWALPPAPVSEDDWLDNASSFTSGPCTRGDFAAFLADYEGDGKPDIVITDRCDVQGVGHDNWEIYKNTGGGFESSPMVWPLPAAPVPEDDWLDGPSTATSGPCTRGDFQALVMELDGDPGPDIVLTDACDVAGVGTDNWQLYPGTCSR
ncbi:MAG: VCBS repeat-containing protein [Alphaproteobacteria bacterium]|nr:VCBS repeat-containing protein [Alphaproteobacteria bacterium]MCB9796127.1 VCBS repeat-containing protein [Alphaproteobacteria bacterium]